MAESQGARRIAEEVLAAQKELDDSKWGGYVWEHLGDAWNDFGPVARAYLKLLAEQAELREFVFCLYETWEPEPPESGSLFDLAVKLGHADAVEFASHLAPVEAEAPERGER